MSVPNELRPAARVWARWIFWIFAAVALFLLLAEHRAHAIGWWQHGLLALCVMLLYLVIRWDNDSGGGGGGDRPGGSRR
ncbi:MAG: DUF2933 domain-containing protein [Rubrivivax sp.]|nr:DUF2933 domain-containing protein [Rubrivivax sp.]